MYKVVEYNDEYEKEWDSFVIGRAMNGTFLQTRNFLNYHPKGRFQDGSLMIFHKNRLIAVIPGNINRHYEGKAELYAHQGSTFGGIIIKDDYYKAEKVLKIVDTLDAYCEKKYGKITLKVTADLFSKKESDLLRYCLGYKGYTFYSELSTYIDLNAMPEDTMDAFDRNKVRNIKKCENAGLCFRELEEDGDILQFYNLLKINLSKYGITPIHTADEILEFKKSRIPENVRFYGVFNGDVEMAGGMLFVFDNVNVIHAQNLSADYRFNDYSPITYLYYSIIQKAKNEGFKALSWGISTEERGSILNKGLIRNKESYASRYQMNYTYEKLFGEQT